MSNEVNLASELRKVIEFDESAAMAHWMDLPPEYSPIAVARWQNARLRPVLLAMVECVEALDTCGILAITVKQASEFRKFRESELDADLMIRTIDRALDRLREIVGMK